VSSVNSTANPSHRLAQLSSLIQHELGAIIARDFEPPSGVLVTLTSVKVLPDLSSVKVGVSILPFVASEPVFKSLRKKVPHWQRLINSKLHLYRVPKLELHIDTTAEKVSKLDKLLDDIKKVE